MNDLQATAQRYDSRYRHLAGVGLVVGVVLATVFFVLAAADHDSADYHLAAAMFAVVAVIAGVATFVLWRRG